MAPLIYAFTSRNHFVSIFKLFVKLRTVRLIINILRQDLKTIRIPSKIPGGAEQTLIYRKTNDKHEEVSRFGPCHLPSPKSKLIIAGLAKANMSLRIPLMRLIEFKSGALPQVIQDPLLPVYPTHYSA